MNRETRYFHSWLLFRLAPHTTHTFALVLCSLATRLAAGVGDGRAWLQMLPCMPSAGHDGWNRSSPLFLSIFLLPFTGNRNYLCGLILIAKRKINPAVIKYCERSAPRVCSSPPPPVVDTRLKENQLSHTWSGPVGAGTAGMGVWTKILSV